MPGHTLINAIAPLNPLYQQTEAGIDPTCRRNAAAIYARRNEIPTRLPPITRARGELSFNLWLTLPCAPDWPIAKNTACAFLMRYEYPRRERPAALPNISAGVAAEGIAPDVEPPLDNEYVDTTQTRPGQYRPF
jgi:hypothetical protein